MTQCPSFHIATSWSMTTPLQDCFKDLDFHIILPLFISYLWSMNTSLLFSLPFFTSTFLSVQSSYPFSLNSITVPHFFTASSSFHISLFLLSSLYSNTTLIWFCVCPSSFHLSSNFTKRVGCSISSKYF